MGLTGHRLPIAVLFAAASVATGEDYQVGDRLEVRVPNLFLVEVVAAEGERYKVHFLEVKETVRNDEWVEANQLRRVVVWKPGDAVEAEVEDGVWKRATVESVDQISCSLKLEDDTTVTLDGRKVRTWIPIGTRVEIDCNDHVWHGPVAKVVGRDFIVRPEEEDGPAECWVYSGCIRSILQ